MPFDGQIAIAGFLGGVGVAAAATGAHYLKRKLSPDMSHAFRTGGHYSLMGAISIMALRAFRETMKGFAEVEERLNIAMSLITCGAILFSWSIYAVCLGAPKFLSPITPTGGVLMVLGWLTAGSSSLLM